MRDHIAKTLKALKKLKGQRLHFSVKILKEHPLFRILILDEDMWVSAYEAAHGHESKIFHFRKDGTATWFHAFEAFYQQSSQRALNSGAIAEPLPRHERESN